MAVQLSVAVRNARLDAIETTIGASPTLELRTGAPPASCAAADTGTVLATMTLPADWMAPASGGVKAMAGTWSDLSADASGTFGHFRIKQGGTCGYQGTAGTAGTDMIMNAATVTAGQEVRVTAFSITDGNA
jgi:hypothetical protein